MSYKQISTEDAAVGMRVVLTTDRYGRSPGNPMVGSEFECTGTVGRIDEECILVVWDNDLDMVRGYRDYELSVKEDNDSEGDYIDMWLHV